MQPEGILLIIVGLFSLVCAIGNWDWYMNSRKAQFMVKIMGRNGARAFYAILGIGLATFGGLMSAGAV